MPNPARDGVRRSAVVWMAPGPRAVALAAMGPVDFAAEANAASLGVLGRLRPEGRIAIWPVISLLARRMSAGRVALIGEAAHVAPPIGAQGLNMSLKDIETLAGLLVAAREAGRDPGDAVTLDAYHRRRWPDVAVHVAAIDALNRAAMAEARPLRDLRRLGLRAIHRSTPLRRVAMRLGLGAG